jgi:hypothetical protein
VGAESVMEKMMRIAALIVGLFILPAAVFAQPSGLPKMVQASIDENKKACGSGVKLNPGFIAEKDINGDGVKDYVLDYAEFECDGSASFFCGTGGCLTQVFASLPNGGYVKVLDDNVRDLKFRAVRGRPAMVLDLHGSACGKVGAAPCSRTLVWDGKTFKRS